MDRRCWRVLHGAGVDGRELGTRRWCRLLAVGSSGSSLAVWIGAIRLMRTRWRLLRFLSLTTGAVRFWVPWVQEEFRKPYADWIDDLIGMTATTSFPAGFSAGALACETTAAA